MRGSVDVHTFLLDREYPHELVHTPRPLPDPTDPAGALGLSPDEFVLVRGYESELGTIIVLVPSGIEPDPELVAEAAAVPGVKPARPGIVSRVTGYPAEWAAPVAHERRVLVLADKSIGERDVVYCWAGEPGLVLKLRTQDLLDASDAREALLGHALVARP